MITENHTYAEAERQCPIPVQTGPIPVSREDVDKAQELQDVFVRGAEWMYQASLADGPEEDTGQDIKDLLEDYRVAVLGYDGYPIPETKDLMLKARKRVLRAVKKAQADALEKAAVDIVDIFSVEKAEPVDGWLRKQAKTYWKGKKNA